MNIEILTEIGFTRGEIKAYMALIQLGESTIGPISNKAKVTPSKVYPILEKLKEKGLITHVIKSGTKYFQALNPNRILDYIGDKEKKLQTQKTEIKELIPRLTSQQESEAKQYATIYESYNGIKTLYDEILDYLQKNNDAFIGFTLGGEYTSKQANLFFKNYDAKRRELKIKTKLIGLEHQKKFLQKKYGEDPNVEIKYLEYAVPTGLIIWDDKVATLLWHDVPSAFVIYSKPNAEAYRKFFNDMWEIAQG